jgi:general stress protein YciG
MAQNQKSSDEMMSVNEAGRRGGEATSQSHGREFYEEIGHQGGQRVRELINEGKASEGDQNERDDSRKDSNRTGSSR